MKLTNVKTLGQKVAIKATNMRKVLVESDTFRLSREELQRHGVEVPAVKDKLGLIMTTASLGDAIAETIRKGSNFMTLNIEAISEDGKVMGLNGARALVLMNSKHYWKAYDRETKTIDLSIVDKIIKENKGQRVLPIYTDADIQMAFNKYEMERAVYLVNDFYLTKFVEEFSKINAETTVEEVKKLQADFAFLTRALGESTIDVKKHVDYVLCFKMSQIISPFYKVVGGVKANKVSTNIEDALYKSEEYAISFGDFDPNNDNVLLDEIGDLKLVAKETTEIGMNNYISILKDNCNIESWKKYNMDLNEEKYYDFCLLLESVFYRVSEMTVNEKERTVAALYNKAEKLGIQREEVIEIAITLCLSTRRNDSISSIFNDVSSTKKPKLYNAAMLFGDIFVAEYSGCDTIEVEVDYETEIDIEEDEVFEIIDGYGACGMLHVLTPAYQNGYVMVKYNEESNKGYLVALYNPIDYVLNKYPDAQIYPVESYIAKADCTFGQYVPADKDNHYGYEIATKEDEDDKEIILTMLVAPMKTKFVEIGQVVMLKGNEPVGITYEMGEVGQDFIIKDVDAFPTFVIGNPVKVMK